ncbi:MAG: AMP-binding protein, partial [Eggerthellaceae bacterium]|nr:AMP-binding protein [Eggerthellaceae bacterium]
MQTVLEWLEASAGEHPDKVAFADVDARLTYAELVTCAKAVGSGVAGIAEQRKPVALYLEKTVRAIAGLFGAVYAGCCYSFIDLRQPQQRIEKIVETLQPACVLVDAQSSAQARELFPVGVELVEIEPLMDGAIDEAVLAERRSRAQATDPLYINFTSGSTGTPKGVAVSHGSVASFIPVFDETLGITSDDVFANQAPLDFDVSVKDIYSTIYLGATVHLVPREYFSVPT